MQSETIKTMFEQYVSNIDDVLVPMASKWMCSKQCACETQWEGPWTSQSETALAKFGRTNIQTDTNDSDGTVRLDFVQVPVGSDATVFVYEAFADCFY